MGKHFSTSAALLNSVERDLEVFLCSIVIRKCHSVLYTFLSGLGPLINYGVLKQSTFEIIQLP